MSPAINCRYRRSPIVRARCARIDGLPDVRNPMASSAFRFRCSAACYRSGRIIDPTGCRVTRSDGEKNRRCRHVALSSAGCSRATTETRFPVQERRRSTGSRSCMSNCRPVRTLVVRARRWRHPYRFAETVVLLQGGRELPQEDVDRPSAVFYFVRISSWETERPWPRYNDRTNTQNCALPPITLPKAPPIHIGQMPLRRGFRRGIVEEGTSPEGWHGSPRSRYRIVTDLQF